MVSDTLYCCNRGSNDTFTGNTRGDYGCGGMFHMIQGVNEQQDFSKGLNTIIAIDAAFSPFNLIRGERLSPSQVCVGGNSRKSRDTIRGSLLQNGIQEQ